MEGTLLKWTNYYNGWQPRYFMLNDAGIISYYKSRELIHEGCKGSCLVVACEVKVHPHDPLRFDLIIPGEQFICLKAKTQSERQQWLVALGSWKSRGTKSNTKPIKASHNNSSGLIHNLNMIDDDLKIKVQELRLYETVLTQRIHALKSIANDSAVPDVKKLDETTSMLNITCDAFIQTLEECVKLATGGSTQPMPLLSPNSSMNSNSSSVHRKLSMESNFKKISDTTISLPKQLIYLTFFSELAYSFSAFYPLSFNEIDAALFLSTCEQYMKLFEKFNGTAFNKYLSDVNNSITILRNKININPIKFQMLHSIIEDDLAQHTVKEKDSTTNALLWLRRSIHFLGCFLNEFGQGDKTVEESMNKAYGQTLKSYHGWISRGIFSVAIRSLPANEDFLISLSIDPNEAREALFERQILNEMLQHSTNINAIVRKIYDFYIEHHIELDDIVD